MSPRGSAGPPANYNLIELAIADLKVLPRAGGGARLGRVTTADIAGYYNRCGFTLPVPIDQRPICNPLK